MRLGAYPCNLQEGTLAASTYGVQEISERHRHRYEVNQKYLTQLVEGGLKVAGHESGRQVRRNGGARRSPVVPGLSVSSRVQIEAHDPHPLFVSYIKAALEESEAAPGPGAHEGTPERSGATGVCMTVEPGRAGDRVSCWEALSYLAIIAGPCVLEEPQEALETAQTLKALGSRLGLPIDLQGVVRQSQPQLARELPGTRTRSRARGSRASGHRNRLAGLDRRARGLVSARGRQRSAKSCRSPPFSVGRPI